MNKILLDTDVILDFFFDREPYSTHAARLLSLCESKTITAFITPVIIGNVYYLLRQTARHEKVVEKLKELLLLTDVLPMDREVVKNALDSGFGDFEDALQNFTATKCGDIDVIITRNIKDFKKSGLAVLSPDTYLKIIAAGIQ
ncbi:MAG: PIN domain-containing protein [Bacteroidota bacterium]